MSIFLQRSIEIATANARDGRGGPFGAVVVKDGKILAEGVNRVTSANDPTAHAEVEAIRLACAALGEPHLHDCEIYASCEPCPMCLGAIYWARIDRVYFAATQKQAAEAGFDDSYIYREIALAPPARAIPMIHTPLDGAGEAPFAAWAQQKARIPY